MMILCMGIGVAAADEHDAFYRGTNLEREEKYAEAVGVFVELADRSPQDPFADDALSEAARLDEERLGKPREAAELYERVARDYPSSRLATRARIRAADLRAGMGENGKDAATLADFNDILYGFAGRTREESIARLEALLSEHPDFPGAPRATYWLGTLYAKDHKWNHALALFREVESKWPDSSWAADAKKAEGDVLMGRHDWAAARAAYRSLMGRGDPALDAAATEALQLLDKEESRTRIASWAWIIGGLIILSYVGSARWGAGSWKAALRALARPPLEAIYLLPVVALFIGAGLTEHGAIARTVLTIGVGGLAITWLMGAALRTRTRVSLVAALAHAGGATIAVAALAYAAIYHEGLVELVVNTIRFGTE
jgi:TolA-binding protein